MKSIILVMLIAFFTFCGQSQDMGLIQFDGLPNSIINPAFNSNHKILVGLGSKKFDLGNSGFTLEEGFEDGDSGKVLRLDNVINKIENSNLLRYNEGLKTLEIAYKIKNTILYFGHEWILNAAVRYNKDLVEVGAFGNEPFIGKKVDLSTDILYNSYNQTAIGVSTGNNKVRFGCRLKLLNGVQNLYTKKSKLELITSDDIYQLELDAEYEIYSSSLLEYRDIDDYDFNAERFSLDHVFQNNWGYGLDFGLSTKIARAEVFMSAIDIGRILWEEQANRYTKQGISTYEGVDIREFIGNDTDYSIEDSIKSILSIDQQASSYNHLTSASIFLGGKYSINDQITLGVVLRRQFLNIDNLYSFMLNAQRTFGSHLRIGISATYKDRSFANVGGHLNLNYGPVLVYAMAHNALGGIFPEKFKSVSFRFGANLRFINQTSEN